MKRIYTLSLFFTCGILQSQSTFNRAFHDYNELVNPVMVTIGNELYVSTESRNANGGFVNYLYNYDVSGDLVFKIAYGYGVTTVGYATPECLLALAGKVKPCTDVGPFNSTTMFARKVNQLGSVVWSANTPTVPVSTPLIHFASFSDATGGIFTDKELFLFDSNGNLDSVITLPFTTVHCGLNVAGDQVLLSVTHGGSPKLVWMDKNGSVVSSTTVSKSYLKMKSCFNQCVLGRNSDGKLDKYSPSLSVLNQGTAVIADFDVLNGSVAHIAQSGNVVSYNLLDTTLAPIHSTTFSVENHTAVAVGLYNSEVCISGYGKSTINNSYQDHFYSAVRKFPKNGSPLPPAEAALTGITANAQGVPYYQSGVATVTMQPKFTVKNNGTSVIKSVKLNAYRTPGMSCGLWVDQEQFTGLSIQPGNSAVLTSTMSYAASVYNATLGATMPVQYCFYLTVPNDWTDGQFSNNENCSTFGFLITDVQQQLPSREFRVFPVPVSHELEVQSDVTIDGYQVYSADGKLLSQGECSKTELTIGMSTFNPGIYFLRLFSNGEVHTKKVVKE